MKRVFKMLFIVGLVPLFLSSQEINENEIIEIFKKIEDSKKSINDIEKPIEIQINDLNKQKMLDQAKANQNEFDDASLELRIDNLIKAYRSKSVGSKANSYSIKGFGYSKICVEKTCIVSAMVTQKELNNISNQASGNNIDYYRQKLSVAQSLRNIKPLSVKKQKIEALETEIYNPASQQQTNSAQSGAQNAEEERYVRVVVGEQIGNLRIENIDSTNVTIKGL